MRYWYFCFKLKIFSEINTTNLKTMSEVFLLLGGNVGDKHKIFSETIRRIQNRIGMLIKVSSIYETEPWGFVSDLFWNQALQLQTSLKPEELLDGILAIENEMGRRRISDQYEARPIDIDIMFYDNLIIQTDRLTIPHPLIGERKFALVPLNEVAPEKIHPVTGWTLQQMLEACQDNLGVRRV
jgi:2-amino-4-hydroxy-6-hydroxymethyldihydropteridine diphosphokinase